MDRNLISIAVDELPLLHQIISDLGIQESIDSVIPQHGNWSGLSVGHITCLWLTYILSQHDHRLHTVEDWSESRLDLLRVLVGDTGVSSYDFTDDKLGLVLDKISDAGVWSQIEGQINEKSLSIYRFGSSEDVPTFRLDAAPMQSHGKIEAGGLLQRGYHKQHANIGQLKVKLCTLDNDLNHFAYPITHLTVSGNTSDDELYIPIIEQSKRFLSGISGYERGNLYVGDSKFGSIGNRAYVVEGEDYYLMPLSLLQLSQSDRQALIQQSNKLDYLKVLRKEGKQEVQIAAGFETVQALSHQLEGKEVKWSERRLFVNGTAYAKSQQHAFDNRVSKVMAQLADLPIRRQGKKNLTSQEEYQEAIDKLLTDNSLQDFLTVILEKNETPKNYRAYGEKPKRIEIITTFSIQITKNQAAIEDHKALLGWQVYGTNAPQEALPFEKCVLKYRHQSNIEGRFDDLRNKVAHLVPIFLQKDERIEGLVNLLLLALKVCAVLEYKMAQALHKNDDELDRVYGGNPKRSTKTPSANRIFNAFSGIAIALVFNNYKLEYAIMTKLEPVQNKILKLLDMDSGIYNQLAEKMQIFFSEKIISET